MRMYLEEVFADGPTGYVQTKTEALAKVFADTDVAALSSSVASQLRAPIEVVSPDALPAPDAAVASQVEDLKRCALDELAADAPLVPGETVSEDLFTYLEAPFEDLAAGTAVLRRTTNLARAYYFFENVRIVSGALRLMPHRPLPSPTDTGIADGNVPNVVIDAAKALLKWMGAEVIAEFFPDNTVPAYFTKVYAEIERIVHEQLTQALLDQMAGTFEGILRFVNNEYEAEKAKSGVTPELLARLQRQTDDMYGRVGAIAKGRYPRSGLPVFMCGATIHLAMLQEITKQRKALPIIEAGPDRTGSTYEDYAKRLEDVFADIVRARDAAVTVKYYERCTYAAQTVSCNKGYQWKDAVTGEVGKVFYYTKVKDADKAKADATKDRNARSTAVVATLTKELNDPKAVAAAWRKAATPPGY